MSTRKYPMITLGYDIGSSSVKVSALDIETGTVLGTAFFPKEEMPFISLQVGWAEQHPSMWWENVKQATHKLLENTSIHPQQVKAIGISYQMHGLVIVDENQEVLRPAIIWCDSRAVEIGKKAFAGIGEKQCLEHLLNSPGNFTASKLKWVKDHEPDIFARAKNILLPGDYIALKMTGEAATTVSGLSEGVMWDFKKKDIASFLLDYYGIQQGLLPRIVPTFSLQGYLRKEAAADLGLNKGIPITYRAGDQPNNAFSLNVLQPGEVAAAAGTSGVVYGVSEKIQYDIQSRVNTFAHVNHNPESIRLGILLCINGTGIMYSWLKKHVAASHVSYETMNRQAAAVPVGCDGLVILPFGNGAERMLHNRDVGCQISQLNFNIHSSAHLFRAAQEGIAFAFHYGINIMKEVGINPMVLRAGHANMFLSSLFCSILSTVSGMVIQLYNTDGSIGAARGAALGAGLYSSMSESFSGLKSIGQVEPQTPVQDLYQDAYQRWLDVLNRFLGERSV